MRRRSLILFTLLLLFGIVISAEIDIQHIFAGVLIALITVWFWHDLGPRLPAMMSMKEILLLGRCLIFLLFYIIEANITVAKTLLFSSPPVNPVFTVIEPDIKSSWGRVLLATCITITPGTITIDIDPETGRFIVHALTEETAAGLPHWRLIGEIKKLETRTQRGEEHVVDTGRTHDIGSHGTLSGDYRADSH